MNSTLFLIIGASVSSMLTGTPSPGHLLAERIGAPVATYAHSGAKMDQVMPTDAAIRDAAMVISIDGFYWYNGFKPDCDDAQAAAEHLLAVRGKRPMVLGTVPWNHGCADRINPWLAEHCVNACILVRLEGPLEPPGLHPNRAFMERIVANIYARP
jgi:hypothetical protein